MTKDELWEAINTGGKVYTYKDEIEAYRTKSVCENPYNTRYLLVL